MIRADWMNDMVKHFTIVFEGRYSDLYHFWAQIQIDNQLKDMGDWISYSSTKEIL